MAGLMTIFATATLLTSVRATVVVPLPMDEIVRRADAIVLVHATGKKTRWLDESRRCLVTDYSFVVDEVIHRGPDSGQIGNTLVLTYWGGTLGEETHAVSDMRLPDQDERLVLMLRPDRTTPGFTPVVGFHQGMFRVADGPDGHAAVRDADGRPLAITRANAIERLDAVATGGAVSPEVDLKTFTEWLRSNVATIKGTASMPQAAVGPDDRILKTFAKSPEPVQAAQAGAAPSATAEPGTAVARAATPEPRAGGIAPAQATPQIESRAGLPSPQYSWSNPPEAPIIVNNFPASFAPWAPEDQYQMSKWNYYADNVFRVYTSPTGTYGWGNGRFDLAGWPSSGDLQRVYGSGWDDTTLGVCFSRSVSGRIVEADIALNPAQSWTLDDEWVLDGGSVRSFRRTMTHELGHMFGLDHNFGDLSVMNYAPSVFRAYGLPFSDDAAGIRSAFPAKAVSRSDLGVYLFDAAGGSAWEDATIPTAVRAGETITFNDYRVENAGTTTIAAPAIEWYLTSSRNFSGTYHHLGTRNYPALPSFHYFTPSSVSTTFTVPPDVPPGRYHLAGFIRNDQGPQQSGFPFDNNRAFSRLQIEITPNDDDYEENDLLAAASTALPEQTWLSSISGPGIQRDHDWYRLAVDPQGYERVVVDCLFQHADGDIDISLHDSSGAVLARSTSVGDNESIDCVVPAAGNYYLRVYYGNQGNAYDLRWDDLRPALLLTENSRTFPAEGGGHSFDLTADTAWSWSSSAPWFSSGESSDQHGNQNFSYTVDANPSQEARDCTISFTNGAHTVTYTILQEGVSFPSFDTWLADHPGADPGGLPRSDLLGLDDDGDGLTLIEEFAFGGNPTVPETVRRAPAIVLDGNRRLLRFFRATNRLSYTVEVSGTLSYWTAVTVDPGNAGGQVEVVLDPAWEISGKLFARISLQERP